MNKCLNVKRWAIDYLSRKLDAKRFGEVEEHINKCPACRESMEQLKEAFILHQVLPDPQADINRTERVRALLKPKLAEIKEGWAQEGFLQKALQDVSWRLREFLQSRTLRPVPVAVGVAMLFAIFILGRGVSDYLQLPVISEVRGAAIIVDAGGAIKELPEVGQRLRRGSTIRTAAFSGVDLVLSGRYSVRLSGQSSMDIPSSAVPYFDRRSKLRLKEGTLLCQVTPSTKPAAFEVLFPAGRAVVKGTQFGIIDVNSSYGEVWVREGLVAVHGRSAVKPSSVAAGNKASVHKMGVAVKVSPLLQKEVSRLEQIDNIGKPYKGIDEAAGLTITSKIKASFVIAEDENRTLYYVTESRLLGQSIRSSGGDPQGFLRKHVDEVTNQLRSAPNDTKPEWLVTLAYLQTAAGKYKEAAVTLESIALKFPDSRLSGFGLMAAGLVYEESLEDRKKAEEYYRKVLRKYPTSLEAALARSRLKISKE